MRWTLFARLEPTVARARRLDPTADRPELARMLVEHNPGLGADPAAASGMAGVALGLLCRLPHDIDEAAASIVDANPLAPVDALARVASLAYVALRDDLLPDDLPGGVGLIDDAISLRATGVGAPNGWEREERAHPIQLGVEARFLSLFLPRDRLAEFDRALGELFWTITTYTHAPLADLKERTRRLIEQPPESLQELWFEALGREPSSASEPIHEGARPELFELCDASLTVDERPPNGGTLRFTFSDGVVIELAGGRLRRAFAPDVATLRR